MIRVRAPMRIDFAGGWTDVPTFAEREGGLVVNAAVSLRVHVEVIRGGTTIRLRAEDLKEHVTIASAGHITYDRKLDLHKAALNMLPVTGGIEILSRSDAPAGSGLGASGALDVALAAGLARCREEDYSPTELAEFGFFLEAEELKLLGGRQDQYAAALGGFHELAFARDDVRARSLAVDRAAAEDLAGHLLLVYTGESHFSSRTHEYVWSAYAAGEDGVVRALREIRGLAGDAAAAIEAGDWRALAGVLDANWRAQQRLHPSIATPAVQRTEAAARGAGAWGVKATGAGAGGCMAILGPARARAAIADAVTAAGGRVLAFAFDFDGVVVGEVEDAGYHA
jgi:D-glycero-alpha-D-manno-heptose-7-phosphate kinase